MARRSEDVCSWSLLDDLPEIHHCDLVAEMLDHAEIVRDEDIGQAALALQPFQQIQDLGLDRDVERETATAANRPTRASKR